MAGSTKRTTPIHHPRQNQPSIPLKAFLLAHSLAVAFAFLTTRNIGTSMLSRGNSDAAIRLRRAKSSSSVQTHRSTTGGESQPFDPEVAHQHAVLAATQAYEAANGRGSPHKKPQEQRDAKAGQEPGEHLGRRQSIRFTGPSAVVVKQQPITRRQAPMSSTSRPALQHAVSFERHGHEVLSTASDGPTIAPPPHEYVERRVSSTPSSYKKIRKSKSMFYPSKTASLSFMSGSSKKRGPDPASARPEVPVRRSLSLSQQNSAALDSPSRVTDHDAAVKLARDTYVRQLEQQRLKGKSSFMDFAKPRKSAKTFRRTVRTSSTTSYGSAIASESAQPPDPPKNNGLGIKAREVSISLKNRLMKVFQRPIDKDGGLPKQQLKAGRAHFGDYMATSNGVQQRYEHHIPSPDGETIRRVDSRGSTSRDTSAFVEKASHPGSIRSVQSNEISIEAPSRVSSWDNSTIGSVAATNHARDDKRLSIIHEHGGPYQPSSSMRSYGDLSRRYAAFNDPLRREYSAGSLYTRLKKEIEENEIAARLGADRSKDSPKQQIADLTPRGSSYKARNLSTGTISEESTETKDPFSSARPSKSVVFNPKANASDAGARNLENTYHGGHTDPQQALPQDDGETTPKGPLREVKSTFFPPSTRIERSSTSPYRRAMISSGDETAKKPSAPALNSSTSNNTRNGFLHVRSVSRSDSIYSRTTSGNTPAPSPSPPSTPGSQKGRALGVAIIDNKSTKYQRPSSPTPKSRTSSGKSSGEWQTFLSSEMAQLDTRTLKGLEREVSPASTIGHKRESAQFDDDEVEVGRLHKGADKAVQPLASLSTIKSPNYVIERGDAMPASAVPALADSQNPKSIGSRAQPKVRIPLSTDLRARSSHASLTNSSSNVNTNKRYGFGLKPSTSGSTDSIHAAGRLQARSSENAGSKSSPEREARLRRMQSSNSVESKRQQDDDKPLRKAEVTPFSARGRENVRPSLVTSSSIDGHSPRSQLMIERFLNNRRKDAKPTEGASSDPAFL